MEKKKKEEKKNKNKEKPGFTSGFIEGGLSLHLHDVPD